MTEERRATEETPDSETHPRQEPDRVGAWTSVILMLFGLAVVAGGVFWARGLLDSEMARSRPGLHMAYGPAPELRPPAPRRLGGLLQGPVGRGWSEREEPGPLPPEQDLESWGWVDGAHTYARIPIERAMALVVARSTSPPHPLDPLPSPGGEGDD